MSYAFQRRRKIRKAINFTHDEWVQVQATYRQLNQQHRYRNITQYMRDVIIKGHIVSLQTLVNTDEYYRMFRGIGTNINQIAHKVNADNTATMQQLQAVQAQLGELKTMFNDWATMWRKAQGN